MAKQTGLSGWGRTFVPGREVRSENLPAVTRHAVLTRGLGRSYGDASLPPSHTLEVAGSTLADRVLGFDDETGVLRAEAGLVLSDMNRLFLPRGFFTPVTPGTRFVTLGGMVASDVHGKNHHVDGTIGRHVQRLLVQTATGRVIECSREHEPELFLATLGGMGLTGHILEVQLKLQRVPSPWIYRESFRVDNLDELLTKLKAAGKDWPFTVAWIDTVATGKQLGRGILYVGRWAEPNEAPATPPKPQQQLLTMPFPLPSGLLNRFTIGMFNRLVYYAHSKPHKQDICDPDTFFYPLDKVRQWNLAYGAAGVTQHQAVIPEEAGAAGIRKLIEVLAETGSSSFLSVIKDCGPEGDGLISFPRPGMSLALDIPITQRTQEVIDRLNNHVRDTGGRIYLTKDGFTRREDFQAMEPRLARFLAVKEKWDPDHRIHSALSDRLFGPPRAGQEDDDEERVERESRAFAEAERERARVQQQAATTEGAASKPADDARAIQSAPPVAVGTPPAEPERAPNESTAPVFKPERTLVGPGALSTIPPPAASEPSGAAPAGDTHAKQSADGGEPVQGLPALTEVQPSVPPPVPAVVASRPSRSSIPPPPARLTVPPPPARSLDAAAAAASHQGSAAAPRSIVPMPEPPGPAGLPTEGAGGGAQPSSERPTAFGKATLVGVPALVVPGQSAAAEERAEGARKEDEKA